MAFCVRSERNIDFNSKENFPGPGQYIKISPKILLNNKRKFPPFFTSGKRSSFVNLKNIPGPGSYNLDKNFIQNSSTSNHQVLSTNSSNEKDENNFQELVTNFNTGEKNSNLSTIWQVSNFSNSSKLNNFSKQNKSYSSKDKAIENSRLLKIYNNNFNDKKFLGTNIGFLSQANRFNEHKKDELNIPGPGYYYESILSSKTEKKIKNKIKNGKIFDKSGSLSRIVSIPSKTMNGYTFKNIQNEKNKSKNNSIINNSENNNINNTSFSSLFKNKEMALYSQNYSNMNLMAYNNKLNDENKNFNNKFQLLINERKFGNSTSTTTSEFIGPGTYDISLIEKKNSIVNWSKGFDLEQISKKNNFIKKAKLLEEMKKNGEYTPAPLTFHGKIRKLFPNKNKVLLLYNLHKIKNNILQNKLAYSTRSNSFIPDKTQIPGPGYYDKDLFPFNEIKKTKSFQLENSLNNNPKKIPNLNYIKYKFGNNKIDPGFGSHCEREINKNKTFEDLSPFSYFQDKNKFDPGKTNTIYKNLILGKTDMSRTLYNNFDFYFPDITNETQENDTLNFETNFGNITNNFNNIDNLKQKNTLSDFSTESERLFKKLDISSRNFFAKLNNMPLVQLDKYKYFYSNPGPGDYNLSQKFIKKSFSTNQMMQSKTERFKESIINKNPGPGAYQIEKNNDKNILLKKIFYKKTKIDFVKEQNIKKIIERNKRRNEIPGVGLYNLDKRNSLVYKVYLKFNKRQGYNSPFLTSSSRFNQQNTTNELSSGDYDPYKFENIQKNNQFMVFNKADRFNKDQEIVVGPGSYKLNKQWNTKSFNKLFSSENEQ